MDPYYAVEPFVGNSLPNDNSFGPRIDFVHQPNLRLALDNILLVDANSINLDLSNVSFALLD